MLLKIFPIVLYLLWMHSSLDVHGQEPLCNKFSFEEQLLEKMVRMEFKVENMFAGIAKTQSEIQDLAAKVDLELKLLSKERSDLASKFDIGMDLLSKDRDMIKSDIDVHKADTTKALTDAAKDVENSVNDFEMKITWLSGDLRDFKNSTADFLNEQAVTYIRWGRTICPNESKIVYKGFAGGSYYSNKGGLSKTICLPREPQFGNKQAGQYDNYIVHAVYRDESRTRSVFGEDMHDQKMTCVVCEASRKSALLMIPVRKECYDGWHIEYTGYLMMSHTTHNRVNANCVDANPEKGGIGIHTKSELYYLVEAGGDILDPPYTKGAELTCVVCTK